ncbi:ComF family protein [Chitinophaga rhizophila]|uniref:ComF family protein n=1 Tax=Chitinophaga rhizophila TaxID=2866212 RepID=A0ABS7GEW9_9BACT|nr:phosphoribosyltransferase family protein [Chitinophaga rhizophila]MBW8686227.1 ComF family protein [Chitinophaga rhizophila]
MKTDHPLLIMKSLLSSLLHLFYPHACDGCGMELSPAEKILCLRCHRRLPFTGFQHISNNPVEKLFWGRVDIRHAMATCYYRKGSLLQQLIYQFKYNQREDIAGHLGRQMGLALSQSSWLYETDGLLAIPMHPDRIRKRGYNQAVVLATGVAAVTGKPLLTDIIVRNNQAASQTRKGRLLRWQNVSESFALLQRPNLEGRHLLLIDDVITTGATIEACSQLLISAGARVSVCTLAIARH